MARGWESKSVETQQEEASRQAATPARPATEQERSRRQQRRTLELSRARAVADLDRASTEAHRAMLLRAIADLDERIRRI